MINTFYNLDIRAVGQKNYKKINTKEEERQIEQLEFGDTPKKLKGKYLDMYKGIQSVVLSTTRIDGNSDFSTIYLHGADITRVRSKCKKDSLYQNKNIC